MENHRTERVAEALREELSEMISYELTDPRIGDATVTEVLVSPDKKRAQVRLHLSEKKDEQQAAIRALEGARNFLRRELALRLNLFRVPDLHFEADAALPAGKHLEQLMKRVRRGRPREEGPVPS